MSAWEAPIPGAPLHPAFDAALWQLDATELRAVAKFLAISAQQARAVANHKEEASVRRRERRGRRIVGGFDWAAVGKRAIEVGDGLAAAEYQTRVSTAALARQRYQRQEREARRQERDRLVMQLAARGWHNDAIGRRCASLNGGKPLHRNTVTRIIRRALRA